MGAPSRRRRPAGRGWRGGLPSTTRRARGPARSDARVGRRRRPAGAFPRSVTPRRSSEPTDRSPRRVHRPATLHRPLPRARAHHARRWTACPPPPGSVRVPTPRRAVGRVARCRTRSPREGDCRGTARRSTPRRPRVGRRSREAGLPMKRRGGRSYRTANRSMSVVFPMPCRADEHGTGRAGRAGHPHPFEQCDLIRPPDQTAAERFRRRGARRGPGGTEEFGLQRDRVVPGSSPSSSDGDCRSRRRTASASAVRPSSYNARAENPDREMRVG